MKNWIIKWGTTGIAVVNAPSTIMAAELFIRHYGERMGENPDTLIKSVKEMKPFEIVSSDISDTPF